MADIAELSIKLAADVARLQSDLAKGRREFRKFAKGASADLASVAGAIKLLKGAMGALGIGVGVGALVSFSKASLKAAADIGETAKQLGLTAEAFQELKFAASQSGVESGELEASFSKLTQSIGDAASGGKTAVDAFSRIGVAFEDNNGRARDNEAVFRDIAEAYKNAADKTKFMSAAQDIFGRGASRLRPLIEDGAAGLDAFAQKARESGQVLSDNFVKQADDAIDRLSQIATQVQNLAAIGTINILIKLGFVNPNAQEAVGNLEAERAKLEQQLQSGVVVGMRGTATMGDAQKAVIQARIDALNEEIRLRRTLLDVVASQTVAEGTAETGDAASSAIKEKTSSLAELVSEMEDQLRLIGLTDRQRAVEEAGLRASEAAQKDLAAGIALTSDQIRDQIELTKLNAAAAFDATQLVEYEAQRQTDLAKLRLDAMEELDKKAKEAAEQQKKQMEELVDATQGLTSSLTNAALGFQSWGDAGKEAIDAVFNLLFAELKKFKSLGGEGGGWLEQLLGIGLDLLGSAAGGAAGGGTAGLDFIAFPGHAKGGHMAAGEIGWVGEEGPELFQAGVAGNIVPNDELGGGGSTVIHFDFRNAQLVEGMVRREIARAAPSIMSGAHKMVLDERRRGGQTADILG